MSYVNTDESMQVLINNQWEYVPEHLLPKIKNLLEAKIGGEDFKLSAKFILIDNDAELRSYIKMLLTYILQKKTRNKRYAFITQA